MIPLLLPILAAAFGVGVVYLVLRVKGLAQRLTEFEERFQRLEERLPERQKETVSRQAPLPAASSEAPAFPLPPPLPPPLASSREPSLASPPPVRAATSMLASGPPTAAHSPIPPLPAAAAHQARPTKASHGPWDSVDWEKFMGARLFAWLGGLALFLGVAYFVKYSFDRDLIPPAARVAIGLATGGALLAGGLRLGQRQYAVTSQTLCATGVVVLYAALFAGHAVYHLGWLPQSVTFGCMAVVTIGAFVLAVRLEARVIAILGLLGGFLTPILLSTGSDQPGALFTYIALLDAGLIAVALHRRWDFLTVLGAVGTALMELGWAGRFFAPERVGLAWTIFAGFTALFTAGFVGAHIRKQATDWVAAAVGVVAVTALGFAAWLLVDGRLGPRPGSLFAFVLAADAALLVVAWCRGTTQGLHGVAGVVAFVYLSAWLARFLTADLLGWGLGLALGFAALHAIFPVVLGRMRPAATASRYAQAFPAIGLAVLVIPILKLPEVSFALWPTLLLLDLLALALAAWVGGVIGALGALLLTGIASSIWIGQLPELPGGDLGLALGIVATTAVLFSGAGVAIPRLRNRRKAFAGPDSAGPSPLLEIDRQLPETDVLLPVGAVLMPFLLLSQMIVHLHLSEPSAILGVALLIEVILIGLAVILRFGMLPLLGLAGLTLLLEVWLASELGGAARPGLMILWCAIFLALFTVAPIVFRHRLQRDNLPWIAAALVGLPSFHTAYRIVEVFWPNDAMGLVPLAFALPPGAVLGWLVASGDRSTRTGLERLAWFGGVTLFFITVALPIQFDRQWLTLGFALEGAALLWLLRRVPHPGLRWVGIALLVVAYSRLILNPAILHYTLRGPRPLLNLWLYTYGVAATSMFAGAALLQRGNDRLGPVHGRPLLTTLGVILAFGLLNLEIADYFTPVGEPVRFQFSGDFGRDMTYTIAWALFALGLVGAGLARKLVGARWSGLGLLAAAVVKLFLHDLSQLDQLYRVGALVGVAIVAIVASTLYQRFMAGGGEARPAVRETTPPSEG